MSLFSNTPPKQSTPSPQTSKAPHSTKTDEERTKDGASSTPAPGVAAIGALNFPKIAADATRVGSDAVKNPHPLPAGLKQLEERRQAGVHAVGEAGRIIAGAPEGLANTGRYLAGDAPLKEKAKIVAEVAASFIPGKGEHEAITGESQPILGGEVVKLSGGQRLLASLPILGVLGRGGKIAKAVDGLGDAGRATDAGADLARTAGRLDHNPAAGLFQGPLRAGHDATFAGMASKNSVSMKLGVITIGEDFLAQSPAVQTQKISDIISSQGSIQRFIVQHAEGKRTVNVSQEVLDGVREQLGANGPAVHSAATFGKTVGIDPALGSGTAAGSRGTVSRNPGNRDAKY